MQLSKTKVIILILTVFAIISCTKEEGPGGTSDIVGRVWVRDYNLNFSILNAEYWAEEEDVYLMYGTDSIFSDRTRTNYDGSFWFQNLREGDYTIYAYSKDSTFEAPSGRTPVFEYVTISEKGETYELPTITILN